MFLKSDCKYNSLLWLFIISTFFVASCVWVNICVPTFIADGQYYYDDQLIFEIIGKAWSQGVPAYTYYLDHKGPFVFLFFCLGYLVDGTRHGLMIFYVIWLTISMVLLFLVFQNSRPEAQSFLRQLFNCELSVLVVIINHILGLSQGIIVCQIVLPYILLCYLLVRHWFDGDNFLFGMRLHILYGVFCSIIVLSRASDAIGVILLYVCYWFYHLIKKHQVWRTIQKALFTILGGLIPFILCLIYFGCYGVVDEFMDCTFWANFRYTPPTSSNDIFGINYYIILLFITGISVLMIFLCFKHKRVQATHMLILSVVTVVHFCFFMFFSSGYSHYLGSNLIDIVMLFVIYNKVDMQSNLSKNILVNIIIGVVICGVIYIGSYSSNYVVEFMDIRNTKFDEYITDAIADDSILLLNDSYVIGRCFDEGKYPASRDCLFPLWHIMCKVSDLDVEQAYVAEVNPRLVYGFDSGFPLLYAEFTYSDLLVGYHLVKMIDVLDKFPSDASGLSKEVYDTLLENEAYRYLYIYERD